MQKFNSKFTLKCKQNINNIQHRKVTFGLNSLEINFLHPIQFHVDKGPVICCCWEFLLPSLMRKPDFPRSSDFWPFLWILKKSIGLTNKQSTDLNPARVEL